MGYSGRIGILSIYIFCTLISNFVNHSHYNHNHILQILFTIFLIGPIYYLGYRFDKGMYYKKEVEEVFDSVYIMLWKHDLILNKTSVSSCCEKVYGYTKHEFEEIDNLWHELVYEEDQSIAIDFHKKLLSGIDTTVQYRIVDKKGTIKWIQNMGHPILNNLGETIGFTGATIDTTNKVQSENAFKILIDSSPLAKLIIKDLKIMYANKEMLRLIEATDISDIQGKQILDFLPIEEHKIALNRMKKLTSGKANVSSTYEFKATTVTGKNVVVESTAIRSIYQNEDVIMIILKDITKSKEMKQKLLEAEEKFRILSEKSLVGVYLQNHLGLVYANQEIEKLLGYSKEELLEINPINLFIDSDKEDAVIKTAQLLNGEVDSLTKEYSLLTKKGSVKNVEIRATITFVQDQLMILGSLIDRTKEKLAERELKNVIKQLEDLKFAMDVSTLVTITDVDAKIIYTNDKFSDISGYSKEELIGMSHDFMHAEQHTPEFINSIWEKISVGETWKGELHYRTKDNDFFWVDTTIVPLLDENDKTYQYIGIQHDITEKVKAQRVVQQFAFFDSLTGLLNRNSIHSYLNDLISKPENKENLFILFIDFDRFKSINDTYGHSFGDLMLKQAAEILERCTGYQGKVFRYGGDEFVIILNDMTHSKITEFCQKIINSFSDSLVLQDIEIFTTPSIGISSYPKDGKTSEVLLKTADMAMYMAKESGKNTYKFYESEIGDKNDKNNEIETELRKAIQRNQFKLYFQPKIQLDTNQLIGYEALIRWFHPKLGMLSPGEFIPIAEEIGLIKKIGEWVIEEACYKVKEISRKLNQDLPIAINISVKQLEDLDFLNKAQKIIDNTGCDPSLLEFEITETVMKNSISSLGIINGLKEIGVKVSIDDFGTGYSNFHLLSEMKIDILKIDRSFIQNMIENKKTLSIVKSIINMGHNLELKIVAEGVETEDQKKILEELKCDIGQGYYFNRPIPFEEIHA